LFWPSLISLGEIISGRSWYTFVLRGPKQKPDPKALLPKTQMRCQPENLEKNALKSAVATCPWREVTGHVNLSHSAMAQAATSHDGPSLGWLRLLTFLLQRLRSRRSLIRDIRDDLIHSASRIKRASHYDAILRILD
jgi:hypothetical protein